MKRFPLLLFIALSIVPLQAQTEARKQEIIAAVGEQAGSALLNVHMAVNSLAERWTKKSIPVAEAKELATSYRESAKLCATLVAGKSVQIESTAAALVKQATALETWINIGDDSMAPVHAKLKAEADGLITGETPAPKAPSPPAAPDGTIELKTTKSVAPNGKQGPLGIMHVTKMNREQPLIVTWKYQNGNGDRGLCVPFPGSGKMATFFGQGIISVGIYKREGKKVTGYWAPTVAGGKISTISMTQAGDKPEYDIADGGKLVLDFKPGMMANATWKFEKGDTPGLAVGEGDYLAIVSMKPGSKAGVAIYSMAPDSKSATGRWIIVDTPGVGEDELIVTKVTGVFSADSSAAAPPAADGKIKDEVKAIAEKLRLDLGNAASLKPTPEQVAAITATPEDAEILLAYVTAVYDALKPGKSAAKENQTVIKVTGPDLKELPGGYTQQISHFNKSGIQIYGFKYLAPGEKFGMSFDGLFLVDGKWVFIPKAWRAFAK
ncbi:MAG: hypothetical protein ABJQ29_00905 [Luteolibacter sp.]